MIKMIWAGKNRLYWLLVPFSLLYGGITLLRRGLYKIGIFKSWKAPLPVIMVGNLSVGGNGKTPLVIYLVEQLTAKGFRVGVISRGYGGKSSHYPLIVSDQTTTSQAGDEPILIYQRTKVPLAVSPKRSDAAKALLANYELDLLLTDDGLQHYALDRDIEIVVVDAKNWFGNGWWLPAGPLRERASRLKSIDMLIINGQSDKTPTLPQTVPAFTMELQPAKATNLLTGQTCDVHTLPHIQAIAGIGYPARFFTMLKSMDVNVEKCHEFADHHVYSLAELTPLACESQTLLMTEKDAVKCLNFAQQNWWYIPIDAVLDKHVIDFLCNKINRL